MNRGTNEAHALPVGFLTVHAAAMGGGAATNGTLPTNGVFDGATGKYPKAANLAASLTYNAGTGIYYMTLSETIKHLLYADGIVVDNGASPTTALKVVVTGIVAASKIVHFRVYTPAGVLTDLGTSDMVILQIDAADTSSL